MNARTDAGPAAAAHGVRRPLIASQLPPAYNRRLESLVGEPVLDLPAGVPRGLPPAVEVLFATPLRMHGVANDAPPPAGWPFGLRWIQLATAGVDGYPGWFFRGLAVTHTRGTAAEPIAEYVVAAMFDAVKNLPRVWLGGASDWPAAGRRPVLGMLAGSTVGLYGFGAIAQAVAVRALGLGMRVLALRRRAAPLGIDGVERASGLAELLACSDHLVLAAPATAETHRAIDRESLASVKPGLHLVNVARGSLIDDEALLEALADGRVGRATLDVTEPEPLPAGHAYYGHPGVRLSPHIAGSSAHGLQVLFERFAAQLARHRAGDALRDRVDAAAGD